MLGIAKTITQRRNHIHSSNNYSIQILNSFCHNRFVEGACQPDVLNSISFLNYNKGSNWSEVTPFGLTTSVQETVSHPLVVAFGLSILNHHLGAFVSPSKLNKQ